LILILSLAPTIGLGIGRFAYALVLPDMRDSLAWSYSAAGFMNTINAVGYLVGALIASRLIKRFGLVPSVRWGTIACVVSLALCALTGNFAALSFARLLSGFAAAAGFVGGGALAATIAQSRPARANFLLSLFYAGPGIGILASGLIAPFTLQAFGPGSWWIVWWALTLLSLIMIVPLLLAPLGGNAVLDPNTRIRFSVRPVLIYLTAYFLFGAGYIAYDLHDRLCPRRRRRRDRAGDFLELDRRQRFRDAMGVAARARARSRRPRHDHHPRHQRAGRGAADLRACTALARDLSAGVRRRLLCGGGIDHGIRAAELSAVGMAGRNRRDDDRVRRWPDARSDRRRRHHRLARQSLLCAERLGRAAGAGRDPRGVSGEIEEIVGFRSTPQLHR
jgi:hypothetical protein